MARKPGRPHKESLYRRLLDPTYAAGYVNAGFEEDGVQGFLGALRNIVKAHGTKTVSTESKVSRSALHQITSGTGNPTATSLVSILNGLDLTIQVKPAHSARQTNRMARAAAATSTAYAASRVMDARTSTYPTIQLEASDNTEEAVWTSAAMREAHGSRA